MRMPIAAAVLLSGCVPFISNRSFMVPLVPLPAAQLAPHDWMTVWAGAQISPAHEVRASDTAVQVPSGQPELGAMFLTGRGHLLVGGALHASWSEWARPSSSRGQPDIKDRLLFGGRVRLGLRAPFTPRFGLIVGLEPGIDWLPYASRISLVGTISDIIPSPALSGSVTPYFENGRLRAYVGVMAWTMSAAKVIPDGESPNTAFFTTNVGLAGGVKIDLESFGVSATLTVPVTRTDPPLLPMFSLALHWHVKRPEPQRAPEPEPPQAPVPPASTPSPAPSQL